MRATISPELALLGFLYDGSAHGYDLYKRVHQEFGPVWRLGLSQMYAIYKNYSTCGWVRIRIEAQGTRPSKKVLALTPAGRKAFKAWMSQSARGLREFRVDFFLRLYFARRAGIGAAEELVDGQTAASSRELQALRLLKTAQPEDELSELTRDFRMQQLTAILKWLGANRERLVHSPRPIAGNVHRSRSLRS